MKSSRKGRPLLVCLVGMDGTGKTTQVKALAQALEGAGHTVRTVPCRWDARSLKPLLRVLARYYRRKGTNLEDYSERASWKKKRLGSGPLSLAYLWFVYITYVFQVWTRVAVPRLLGRSVVCDRYVYDMVIDVALDRDYPRDRARAIADRFLRILPRPDLVFLLDLDERKALERDRPKGENFPLSYFSGRRRFYLHLAGEYSMVVYNAEDGIQSLSESMRNLVFSRLEEQK